MPSQYCTNRAPHHDHQVYGPEGQEDWCLGVYPVLAEHGQWQVVGDDTVGYWVSTNLEHGSNPPDYYIDRERLHEDDWDRQVTEKTWVDKADFRAALADARRRWPRS